MAGTRRQITWLTGSRALRWGLPVVLLLAGCYAYVPLLWHQAWVVYQFEFDGMG